MKKKERKEVPEGRTSAIIIKVDCIRGCDSWGDYEIQYKTWLKAADGRVDWVGQFCGVVDEKIQCDWYQVEKHGRIFAPKWG